MSRLKVLFITTWYPTKEHPIGGVFVREHAKAAALYTDVVVLHHLGTKPDLKALWRIEEEIDCNLTGGIPTYRVWSRHLPIPLSSYLTYIWSVLKGFRYIVSKGFQPDIIHAHIYEAGVPSVLIGKLYRIPVVITEHSSSFPRKMLAPIDVHKARFGFKRAEIVLPVSYALQKGIEGYGIKARFQIIPNGIDTTLFYPSPDFKKANHQKRILFVGLLVPVKGLAYLLDALAQLRLQRDDWFLDIVGDGPKRTEYERLADNLDLSGKVSFHGLRPKEEVAEFMRQADFLVLPSFFETFSVVAAEALATGTPVLAARCGGPEEFVNGKVGQLVSARDVGALCKGLNYMLDHLDRFIPDELSGYASKLFSFEDVGAELRAVYRQILGLDRKSFRAGYSGERISIAEGWHVLDVGSGHNPHPRADVLLERALSDHTERSGKATTRDGRPLVVGDAQYLPFKDRSFDYVIASQIAEHVPEPNRFCVELQRVALRGYIECPGPISERLLGEPFHLWTVMNKRGKLVFKKKLPNSPMLELVSDFFYALFYVGRERSRSTIKPRSWIQRKAFFKMSSFISIVWRSKWLRRWTYTCYEFNKSFDFQVIDK